MIISHEYEFIFVHVPRTAGTSISRTLCDALRVRDWEAFIGEPTHTEEASERAGPVPDRDVRKHATAKTLRRYVGEDLWSTYWTFSLVRNPWERSLSMYLKRRKEAPAFLRAMWPRTPLAYEIALRIKYQWLDRESTQQFDYLSDGDGNVLVDYVGRYETLADDFSFICDEIGLEAETNVHHDPTGHGDYRRYFTDTSRQIVREKKSTDIETFGYQFEGTG